MAGAVPKIFGILFLLLGIVLLVAGLGAAVVGAMDEGDHQEDQGPLGTGKDDDRQQVNAALVAGGAVTAGLGILSVTLGIILMLVGGRDRSQQQQIVITADDAPALATQQQQTRDPRRVGLVAGAGVLLLLVLLVAGLAGDTPLADALNGTPEPRVIATDEHAGNMGFAAAGGGTRYGGHEQEFRAPHGTQSIVAHYTWDAVAGGADRLRIVVSVEGDAGFESVLEQDLISGEAFTLSGQNVVGQDDWGGLAVRFRIEPADQGIYQGQPFVGRIQWVG